jgi:tetratricopeptide (TPR) repeat protein
VPGIILFLYLALSVSPAVSSGQATSTDMGNSEKEQKNNKKIEESLQPIPVPPLDHLEKSVSKQLREGRKMVDSVVNQKSVEPKVRANAYGELGQLYHAYDLTDAAEVCYRNAVLLDPSGFDWTYGLAYLLQTLGKFSEALQFYSMVKPGQKETDLHYLLFIRRGECYYSLNQPEKAKKAFTSAYAVNPKDPAVLARLGELALAEKNYNDAVKYLSEALDRRPDANKLHYMLAMAYRGTGKMDLARDHLARRGMVGVQPPDPLKETLEKLVTGYRVQLLAGKLAFSAGRYIEAAEAFKKAIEADPKQPAARINLGTTLGQMKKYREALAQFQAAVKLAPDNVTVHFNLGSLYSFFGDFSNALKHLKKVVEKDPKDAGAHLNLADTMNKAGRIKEAFDHYRTAASLKQELTMAWLNMSTLLTRTGQHAESLAVLEDAHSRLPHDGIISHALARMLASSPLLAKRDGKRALQLAIKVHNEMNDYKSAWTLAFAYAELNQCEKAVEWMEKAVDMASDLPGASNLLKPMLQTLDYFKANRPCRIPAGR